MGSKLQDRIMINNLLEDDDYHEFRSSEFQYIQDSNNASYTAGNIVFRTSQLRSFWKSWYDAYLAIPISITGGTLYTGGELLAYKQSFLSAIYGIHVKLNGTTVMNDTSIEFINNLRLLTGKSVEWALVNGPEIGFAKDETNDISELMGSELLPVDPVTHWVAPTAGTAASKALVATATKNPVYNKGFYYRASFLQGNYAYRSNSSVLLTAGTVANGAKINFVTSGAAVFAGKSDFGATPAVSSYSLVLHLPLRLLHPFFESLNFPVINDDFEMTFMTHNNSSQTFSALQSPTGGSVATMAIRSACRLYYRKVEFQPSDASRVNALMAKGYTKQIKYNVTDTYTSLANQSEKVSLLVTASAVNPKRLWVCLYTAGQLELDVASAAPMNCPIRPLTSNLRINNINLFQSPLETRKEHWEELKRQLKHIDDNKSQLNYVDYLLNYQGLTVYDLERFADDRINVDTSNEIVYNMTKLATSTDIVFVLERQEVMDLKMSSGVLLALIA